MWDHGIAFSPSVSHNPPIRFCVARSDCRFSRNSWKTWELPRRRPDPVGNNSGERKLLQPPVATRRYTVYPRHECCPDAETKLFRSLVACTCNVRNLRQMLLKTVFDIDAGNYFQLRITIIDERTLFFDEGILFCPLWLFINITRNQLGERNKRGNPTIRESNTRKLEDWEI